MSELFSVAIDGPSGAGKSTLSKRAAAEFGFVFVDTGAIYRTVGLACSRKGTDLLNEQEVAAVLPELAIDIRYDSTGLQRMILNGEDVTSEIRLPEISMAASDVSAHPATRAYLMEMQRRFAREYNVIMDGRDIGTVVLPDADLKIFLTASAEAGEKAIETTLSTTETYRDIIPQRISGNKVSGYISIMRGCNNFCTYCIVPYTRGRERSREPESILNELRDLQNKGFKEVILLGQNVNSYLFKPADGGEPVDMAALLALVAEAAPEMRVRFTTSNPEDLSDEIIATMASHDNICNHIHLPVQSGSNKVLKLMNRKYTREWYLDRIAKIREAIPDCGISSDMFTGFHDETEEDFEETLSLMREVGFDSSFMFKYSERPGTMALRIPYVVNQRDKQARTQRMIELSDRKQREFIERYLGTERPVLMEAPHGDAPMHGFTDNYIRVNVPHVPELVNTVASVRLDKINDDLTVESTIIMG